MRIKLFIVLIAAILTSCGSLPKHEEQRVDQLTTIIMTNVPKGAVASVDGVVFVPGVDEEFLEIYVEPGMHEVEVRILVGNALIYKRDIFLEGGTTRKIKVGN